MIGSLFIVAGVMFFTASEAFDWPGLSTVPAIFLGGIGLSFLGAARRRRQQAELPPQRRMDGSYEDAPREQAERNEDGRETR
ncbi:hypothetical protein [Serinibacter arcticus]|uniref:hypothetical protein n=1 Tax=Serinibacter arcticus TaxID=1655435 RepID=UPI0011B1E0DD|nr:hypothetical protein [Serinibacter arcticus]